MEIFYILHVILILFVISIPLLPLRMVKKFYLLPLIFPVIWAVFGRCPMNDLHKQESTSGFVHEHLRYIFPNISTDEANNICYGFVIGTFLLSLYRIYGTKKRK